jgi:hypothetical protein
MSVKADQPHIGLDVHVTVYDVGRRLPAIADLRGLCRSLAMLDAILSPDWEGRYYSFNASWADGEQMASMRNGSGDEYAIVFSVAGAYVRGFDHESPMSPYANEGEPWPGVIDEVPELFKSFVEESAFSGAVKTCGSLHVLIVLPRGVLQLAA